MTSYDFTAADSAPEGDVQVGQLWHDDTKTNLDILIKNGTGWDTVPTNNIVYSTSAPSQKADGTTAIADGDIWIDTDAPEREYPKINRRISGSWITYDNTDQSTDRGVLFDNFTASPRTNGESSGALRTRPSGALTTEILFEEAPDPGVYPDDMLAVNMAMSRNTVRVRKSVERAGTNPSPTHVETWVNAVSNHADGSGAFGRLAQRK